MTPHLRSILRAGLVRRWHCNADLADTCDRLDGHQGRVARIILALHPNPSASILRGALTHDDGERATGDVPWNVKRDNPALSAILSKIEAQARADLWGCDPALTDAERLWLRYADRLDAYMWAMHHAPHLKHDDDWRAAWDNLHDMAMKLGVA